MILTSVSEFVSEVHVLCKRMQEVRPLKCDRNMSDENNSEEINALALEKVLV